MTQPMIATCQLMAGIAGSDKLHESLKQDAANILAILLPLIKQDAENLRNQYGNIIKPSIIH